MERLVTKNKKEVYILDKVLCRINKFNMFADVKEAISKIYLIKGYYKDAVDLGRIIGKCNCVEVKPSDHVKWLWMKNKQDRIPFVFGREGEDTSLITIIINERNGRYVLSAAYYGRPSPMTHKDAAHKGLNNSYVSKCYAFWQTHALIYDEKLVNLSKSKELLEN